jgi:6-phosphogluconolactonase
MSMSRIEVAESLAGLHRAAAESFVRVTTDAVQTRGRCVVALTGGTTSKGVYQLLADPSCASRVLWDRIEFFWGDERHVPPDHADSNYRMAFEALLSKVPVRSGQLHRMRGDIGDADRAARDYEAEMRTFFGDVAWPRFDLIHLGIGTDGHTASLFPGTSALDEQRRWCVANWVDRLNAFRITLTFPVLNAARSLAFIVNGAAKAPIVREILASPDRTPPLPAQLVRPTDGAPVWMLDRDAAAYLGDRAS